MSREWHIKKLSRKEKEELIRGGIEANPSLELIDVAADGDWIRVTAKKK